MENLIRVTVHEGRTRADGSAYNASHNDRRSGVGSHVDASRIADNRYLVWDDDGARKLRDDESFNGHEKARYKALFSESLDAQNRRYEARRQYDRVRTMDKYRRLARSCPAELILQIGDMHSNVTKADIGKSLNAFLTSFCKQYPSVIPLDIALHFDESSYHAHFRYVYVSHGKDGLEVSQRGALRDMGIERPDMSVPESRYNHPKITFMDGVRDLFIRAVEQETTHRINRVPEHPGKKSVDLASMALKRDYDAARDLLSERELLISQRNELIQDTLKLSSEREQLQQEVEALQAEKSRLQRITERIRASCMTLFKKLARVVCQDGRCALEHVKNEAQAVLDAQDELIRDEIDTDER